MTKVHVEAKKFAADGYTIVLVGHAGHEEVEGTMGEAPEHIVLIENEEDVAELDVPDPSKVAYISQTTLSGRRDDGDHRRSAESVSGDRRPPYRLHLLRDDESPGGGQAARSGVRAGARDRITELVDSNRLVEVAREHGAESHLIDNETEVREEWLVGKRVVGITSGASAPEELVAALVDFFRERGTTDVTELKVIQEDVRFMLPKPIRQAAGTA